MSIQPSVQDALSVADVAPSATASLMQRHRVAQTQIIESMQREGPIAVLKGPDSFELGRIISSLVTELDDRTTVVRLQQPHESALEALREITRTIGFAPNDLTLSDLQNVLTLFLQHQGKHRQRTVLFVERADEQPMWLLDFVAKLVRLSESSQLGRSLFIVLSGGRRLTDVLQNTAFDVIRQKAGRTIELAPLSNPETRELLCQISASTGCGDIEDIFAFDAVERLHGLGGGVPSLVARLFRECMAIVKKQGLQTVTPKVVVTAARNLRADMREPEGDAVLRPKLVPNPGNAVSKARRLLIRCPEQEDKEIPLRIGRFMVGRASTADIRLESPSVSRRHALIIATGKALQVLDLGGTNGTLAGDKPVSEATLRPGTVLTPGDCQIEYVVD